MDRDDYPDLLARFLAKVPDRPADRCWIWQGAREMRGYGKFRVEEWLPGGANTLYRKAHRVSFALFNGPLAERDVVRHVCDNPRCVNPAHLQRGTQQQNVDDCETRGRARHLARELNGRAKLTEADVVAIRATPWAYGADSRLGRHYGVCPGTIRDIRIGRKWR